MMKKNKSICYNVGLLVVMLLLIEGALYSQTAARIMQIHYRDGATSEVPVAMIDSITFSYNNGNSTRLVVTDSISSNEVLQRAWLMASMKWTPLRPIPKRNGFFEPNVTVTGAPYSSVKEINTYLFQDVSYHTFMTAVHNPNSVLYTENISRPPYHGLNCATYYGAVCSSSIMWAYGIEIPYFASQIITLPGFSEIEHQVIDSLKICDVIWKTGHVQMIYDMEYKADTLYRIKAFETSGDNAHIKSYKKEKFFKMWNDGGYVAYRYDKLIASNKPAVFQGWESIAHNEYLCPSKGDKSVYRTTDTVTINILDSTYNQILLVKEATLVASDDYSGKIHQYHNLQPGIYDVFLQRGEERTASVSFEIINTEVSYSANDDDNTINIYFQSSAMPNYAAICDLYGNARYFPISDYDRWRGFITVKRSTNPAYKYCKVIFKGKYGSIINVPIRME